eukprot:1239637-Amphidinium_carterae.1
MAVACENQGLEARGQTKYQLVEFPQEGQEANYPGDTSSTMPLKVSERPSLSMQVASASVSGPQNTHDSEEAHGPKHAPDCDISVNDAI